MLDGDILSIVQNTTHGNLAEEYVKLREAYKILRADAGESYVKTADAIYKAEHKLFGA